MENGLKILSQEFKNNLEEAIATGAFKDVIKATKEAEDSGTFEVVISTADVDRSGEIVDQNGWNLELYKMNPIVLWGHDYYALPIGICDSIELIEGKLIAKGRFAPAEANPFAQQVRKLYDAKIVRATSVGFIVSKMDGNTISQAELLEFSFVPVPANPYALSLRDAQSIGLDVSMLAMKGLTTMMQKEEATEEAPAPEAAPEETPAPEEAPAETAEATESPEANENPETVETPASDENVAEKNIYVETKASEELAQAIGAELAAMQATCDAAITDGARRIMELINAEEGGEEEPEVETPDKEKSKAEEPESNDAVIPEGEGIEEEATPEAGATPDEIKEFNEFKMNRQILRALATATTNALEQYNKRARDHARRD